jgi:glycine dehydrogenase
MSHTNPVELLQPLDTFPRRHLGPSLFDIERMIEVLGVDSLDALIDETVPPQIRLPQPLQPRPAAQRIRSRRRPAQPGEPQPRPSRLHRHGLLRHAHPRRDPAQHPGKPWLVHTVHALPGRNLPGAPGGDAQLPDDGDGTDRHGHRQRVAARRGHRRRRSDDDVQARPEARPDGNTFFVSDKCHPQTIDVVRTRAEPLGYTVVVGDHASYAFGDHTFGALVQYPDTEGTILDFSDFCDAPTRPARWCPWPPTCWR